MQMSKATSIILPLFIIAIGIMVAAFFLKTAPTIKRTPPEQSVPVVEVITAERKDAAQILEVMGTVTPARQISLRSRVSGEVLFISSNFLPGGHIAKDEVLLKIDPTDYQIEVEKARSVLDSKKAALAIEEGNQSIAREEMRLMSETSKETVEETDLALRKPQLKQAQAAVSQAEADLRKALLNLERTVIRAPFNTLITERNVNLGAQISTQDILSILVGTDEFWVEAAVPLDQIASVKTGRQGGSNAVIQSQGNSAQWNGHVLHSTGTLNEKSRMAKMIITVMDPLGIHSRSNGAKMMLDDYVTVRIEGKTIHDVIKLPRTALRDGNTVWVFDNGKLSIRAVSIVWKHGSHIFVKDGVNEGDAVIVSVIPTPVNGMRLSISDSFQTTDRKNPAPLKGSE